MQPESHLAELLPIEQNEDPAYTCCHEQGNGEMNNSRMNCHGAKRIENPGKGKRL